MKQNKTNGTSLLTTCLALLVALTIGLLPGRSIASGGSGSGGGGGGPTTPKVDTIKVSKCFYAAGGTVLLNASSSDSSAHVYAYLPSGAYLGEVVNGRYGGSVFYVGADPGSITFKSSSGGVTTAPTTPWVL